MPKFDFQSKFSEKYQFSCPLRNLKTQGNVIERLNFEDERAI